MGVCGRQLWTHIQTQTDILWPVKEFGCKWRGVGLMVDPLRADNLFSNCLSGGEHSLCVTHKHTPDTEQRISEHHEPTKTRPNLHISFNNSSSSKWVGTSFRPAEPVKTIIRPSHVYLSNTIKTAIPRMGKTQVVRELKRQKMKKGWQEQEHFRGRRRFKKKLPERKKKDETHYRRNAWGTMKWRNVKRKERNKGSDGGRRNEVLEINSWGQEDSSEVFLIRPSLRGAAFALIFTEVFTLRDEA